MKNRSTKLASWLAVAALGLSANAAHADDFPYSKVNCQRLHNTPDAQSETPALYTNCDFFLRGFQKGQQAQPLMPNSVGVTPGLLTPGTQAYELADMLSAMQPNSAAKIDVPAMQLERNGVAVLRPARTLTVVDGLSDEAIAKLSRELQVEGLSPR